MLKFGLWHFNLWGVSKICVKDLKWIIHIFHIFFHELFPSNFSKIDFFWILYMACIKLILFKWALHNYKEPIHTPKKPEKLSCMICLMHNSTHQSIRVSTWSSSPFLLAIPILYQILGQTLVLSMNDIYTSTQPWDLNLKQTFLIPPNRLGVKTPKTLNQEKMIV